MDKRYYSAKHKRIKRGYVNKKQEKEKSECSTFILRLNICLGLAIVIVGAYQLRHSFGERLSSYLSVNTSVDTMKATATEIKDFVIDAGSSGIFGGEEFILDEDMAEYINNWEENSYFNVQKKLEAPNEIWQQPVNNGTITDVFGNRNNPVTGKSENHKGIDIGVPMNTEAKAVKSGIVIDKGYSDSYGNWVKYKTYDGYVILYAHLSSVAVEKEQEIKQGDVIAYTGSTGNSTGPHLHYEIMENNEYLDPYSYYMEAEGEN